MRTDRTFRATWATAILIGCTPVPIMAFSAEGLDCDSARQLLIGRYAVCMAKAERTLLSGDDAQAHADSATECMRAHTRRWERLETPTSSATATCPTRMEPGPLQDLVDRCTVLSANAIQEDGPVPVRPTACAADRSESPMERVGPPVYLGNATPDQVLEGWTFSSSTAGVAVMGTMPHRRSMSLLPAATDVLVPRGFHDGTGKCVGDADLVADNIKRGVEIFGVMGTFPHARSLKTGQTACYGNAGEVRSCTASLQDGALRRGADRGFFDFGNGTINDSLTGLTWEKLTDDGGIHDVHNKYTFAEATASKIAALNAAKFGGHDDWRLPNRTELESLVHLGKTFPSTVDAFNSGSGTVGACPTGCTNATCSCTHPLGLYWTSSTYVDQPDAAWAVYFGNGGMAGDLKSKRNSVRAVRR